MARYLMILLLCGSLTRSAAQSAGFYGWLSSTHTQKLSAKWNILSDIQFRSGAQMKYLQTILLRPAIEYNFSKRHHAAVGYTYFGDKKDQASDLEPEHRIWEQYLLKIEAGRNELNQRLRLEQRFLPPQHEKIFAQRLRYFAQFKIPFVKQKDFSRGVFAVLQNEIFLNVQHKENSGGNFFDQNRGYGSIGYRFAKSIELEAGYMFRYQREDDDLSRDHILQLLLTTSL